MESGARTGLHGSACDACRRRRVRCVGQQPCDGCRRNGIVCTYGDVGARTSAVGYARLLEQRVVELEALLHQATQNQDDGHGHSSLTTDAVPPNDIPSRTLDMVVSDDDVYLYRDPSAGSTSTLYGALSGLNMLRAVVAHTVQSPTQHQQASLSSSGQSVLRAFDKTFSRVSPQQMVGFSLPELPPRAGIEHLVERGIRLGLIGFYCFDAQDLSARIDGILANTLLHARGHGEEDIDSIALIYALLALGQRFQPMEEPSPSGNGGGRQRGLDYFRASHKLLDMTMAHNLCSVRTAIVQTRYLLSTSMVSQAYLRHQIGVTMTQQMGLGVASSHFSDEETRQRRIVLATVNMQETFFSSVIGIPKTMRIEPQLIIGFEDEELLDGSSHPGMAEAVRFQQLGDFMSQILRHRYPTNQDQERNEKQAEDSPPFQAEDVKFVEELGDKIEQWHRNLPLPSNNSSDDGYALTAQLSVRLMHAAAQNMLYRPYLHYLARASTDPSFNMHGFEYGSRCVRSAMQAIWIIDALRLNRLLHEAQWFTIYMLVYASIVLIYFTNNAKHRVTVDEASEALAKARALLEFLALYNGTADRCSRIITTVVGASHMAA